MRLTTTIISSILATSLLGGSTMNEESMRPRLGIDPKTKRPTEALIGPNSIKIAKCQTNEGIISIMNAKLQEHKLSESLGNVTQVCYSISGQGTAPQAITAKTESGYYYLQLQNGINNNTYSIIDHKTGKSVNLNAPPELRYDKEGNIKTLVYGTIHRINLVCTTDQGALSNFTKKYSQLGKVTMLCNGSLGKSVSGIVGRTEGMDFGYVDGTGNSNIDGKTYLFR